MYDYEAEYEKLKEVALPLLNEPSLYPVEAPLPEDPFLREGIEALRELEPEIPALNRTRLNNELYIYKQRILSWGYTGKPIDERYMVWANRVASKYLAALDLIREQPARARRRAKELGAQVERAAARRKG